MTEGRRLIAHELTHTLQQGIRNERRVPLDAMQQDDRERDPEGLGPARMRDPRGPGQSTLTYAESRELRRCIDVMGDSDVAVAECANLVLGTPIPEWKSVGGRRSTRRYRARARQPGHRLQLQSGSDQPDHPTTYRPGATPGGASSYGRGTTQADRASGQTTLGFHEGEHGRDFIQFLQDHPYPVFEGRIGQTRAVFIRHIRRYRDAVQQYVRRMTQHSLHATDCVGGTTIDESNSAQGRITRHCRGVRARR